MKTILKLGDIHYAKSLQKCSPSYTRGFPQREYFLEKHSKDLAFEYFRHPVLRTIDDVVEKRHLLDLYLSKNTPDYLLVDNPLDGLLLSKSIQIPIIFDSIDWYDEMYLKEYGINETYYLLRYGLVHLLGISQKVISQSPVNLRALQCWGLQTKKTCVIPNGYDKTVFFPYKKTKISKLKKEFSKKYHVDLGNKKIITYTGKLGAWYDNILLICRAIQDDQVLFIVGDGPLRQTLPKQSNIISCGAVPYTDVPKFTNVADALVFPVDVDCSPIAISEYLAVGKPIVMGVGRIEWLLKNGVNGRLVTNNEYAWKQGIQQAIAMGEQCKKYNCALAKELSWQYLTKKFTNFIYA
ncbi:MAG: glycosyltransferase [Microgenomates group bacterium]